MTLKSKMSLLVLLTTVSVVSVGFSSWAITTETNAEIGGNIEVDNVINSDDFIRLDTTKGDIVDAVNLIYSGIDSLDYNENGYVNSMGVNGSSGNMEVFYILDIKECKNFFTDLDSIKVLLTLKYASSSSTSLDMFANNAYQSIDFSLSDNIKNYKDATPNDAVQLSVEIDLENILKNYVVNTGQDELYFSIKYDFYASISGGYYKNYIYPFLQNNDLSLIAQIEGY